MAAAIKPDRELAAEVRRLTLKKIKKLLELEDSKMSTREAELHDAVLLRLAGSVLPRLAEVTGEDGAPIKLVFDRTFNELSNSPSEATGDSTEQG